MIGLNEFGRSRESALARVSLLSLLPYSPSELIRDIHASNRHLSKGCGGREIEEQQSSAEELRGCDDAETRLLLEVRGTILLRRSPQVAAPCRTLCRVASGRQSN